MTAGLVLVLAACAQSPASEPPVAPPAPAATDAPAAPATKALPMPESTAEAPAPTVQRPDLGPAWDAAFDAALARFAANIAKSGANQVALSPTTDPHGTAIPHMVDLVYGEQRGRILVRDGEVVLPGAGAQVAAAVFADLGHPDTPLSHQVALEVLGYCKVVTRPWYDGAIFDWDRLDERYTTGGGKAPTLRYDGTSAVLTLTRAMGGGGVSGLGGIGPLEVHQLEVHIDGDGTIRQQEFELDGGRRTPVRD